MSLRAALLFMALIVAEMDLGEFQSREVGTPTCNEQQQALIEQFGLAVVSQIWYPTCLPGGYFKGILFSYTDEIVWPIGMIQIPAYNVQCSFNHCFCAYLDTGKEIRNSRRGKSAEELLTICPWVSKEPPTQCSLPPKFYPCGKRLERYYYDPELRKCEMSASSCLGFLSLGECEITCGINEPPPIRCMVGEIDASKGGKCVRSSARPDKKKCIFCGCEDGYELSRDRSVCVKAKWTRFSCNCEYDGRNRIHNIGANITRVNGPTGEIILRCNAPDEFAGITWSLNRVEFAQNCETEKYCISKDGRYLNLWDADYTYSGNYECRFVDETKVRSLTSKIVISATAAEACGQSPGTDIPERATPPRIIGGIETKVGMAPFVVLIRYGSIVCGGSLISHRYVVTVAHCVNNVESLVIKVGAILFRGLKERYEQSAKMKRILIHENYDAMTHHADIALIELEEPVYFSYGVKPICIAHPSDTLDEIEPSPSSSEKKKYGVAFGWGIDSTVGFQASKQLKEVSLPVVSREECQKMLTNVLPFLRQITDLMFCAGGEKNKDTCHGDAGGPFALWSKQRKRWYLGGMSSTGPQNCGSGLPGVYTKIADELRRWIYNNSDLNSSA